MSSEIKSKGVKAGTTLSKSLHAKLKAHAKKDGSSIAQILRDQIQKLLKK